MHAYLTQLLSTTLPMSAPIAIFLWALSYTMGYFSHRAALKLSKTQELCRLASSVDIELYSPVTVVGHVIFALTLFIFSFWRGDSCFAFIGGGWLIVSAVLAVSNLHSLLRLSALTASGSASGSLTFSTPYIRRTQAYARFFEALILAIAGLIVPHLALLGGILFLIALGLWCLWSIPTAKKTNS